MNYIPLCGYWFYGGTTATERAGYFASYGLLGSIPGAVPVPTLVLIMMQINQFCGGILL